MAMYAICFEVEGRGEFPLDMLRYDQCHPARADDAAVIGYTRTERTLRGNGASRVRLTHYAPRRSWLPTSGRWSSFLWSVDPQSLIVLEVR